MKRFIWILLGVLIALGLFLPLGFLWRRATLPPASNCLGPPLGSAEAREDARLLGYHVDPRYDCIVQDVAAARRGADKARPASAAAPARRTLAEARRAFKTALGETPVAPQPLPQPPPNLFVRADYTSAGHRLAAYVTPNPGDGQRYPAIVWLTGGDSNTLDDFWSPGPAGHDQSAQAFRRAGMVMFLPTLRGGNTNPGQRERLLGEVDDVLAAADQLAKLPYVDPQQIYLGGHSTGATLALLVAETSPRFKAVLAFGPAARVQDYGAAVLPVDWSRVQEEEARLRSPLHWLAGIHSPVYLIEGQDAPSNRAALDTLCARAPLALVRCIRVPRANHFSTLGIVAPLAAARIMVPGPEGFHLQDSDFQSREAHAALSTRAAANR